MEVICLSIKHVMVPFHSGYICERKALQFLDHSLVLRPLRVSSVTNTSAKEVTSLLVKVRPRSLKLSSHLHLDPLR